MMRIRFTLKGVTQAIAYALVLVLVWATATYAQSAADQYGTPTPPSGPAAGAPATILKDTDGVINAGDALLIPGNFTVADGASIVLGDSDDTQGTLIDGVNAEITAGEEGLEVDVSGDPINVAGGSGTLETTGLTVVATTGISSR
jgi:hypothetical protein